VENKKINLSFYLVTIAFLVLIIVLLKDFKRLRANDFKEYAATVMNIINRDNFKIRILSNQLAVEERENADLKNTLTETRNALDNLSKKLVSPTHAP